MGYRRPLRTLYGVASTGNITDPRGYMAVPVERGGKA